MALWQQPKKRTQGSRRGLCWAPGLSEASTRWHLILTGGLFYYYYFLEKEGERERERNIDCLPPRDARTGDRACRPSFHGLTLPPRESHCPRLTGTSERWIKYCQYLPSTFRVFRHCAGPWGLSGRERRSPCLGGATVSWEGGAHPTLGQRLGEGS